MRGKVYVKRKVFTIMLEEQSRHAWFAAYGARAPAMPSGTRSCRGQETSRMRGVPNRSCSAYGSIRVVPVLAAGDAAGAVDPQAGWWRAWRARFGTPNSARSDEVW